MRTDFADDIPLDLARAAHAGTSFTPDERAVQERDGYAATLARDLAALTELATTDEKRATLAVEFERYRQGYAQRVRAHLRTRARCVSTMIAGPSNFPVRRQQKINAAVDRRAEDLIAFRARALNAIRKTLTPELAPVMAGDADAVVRLQAKIDAAEKLQARMKAANTAIRKHAKGGADTQIAALVALGFHPGAAADLLKPDFAGRIGFPAFELTNNNANIRRMRGRLESISRAQATPTTEIEGDAARLEDDPPANRVRRYACQHPIDGVQRKPARLRRPRTSASGFPGK